MMCQDIYFRSKIWIKIFLFNIQDFFIIKLRLNFDAINEYVLVLIELACQFDDHLIKYDIIFSWLAPPPPPPPESTFILFFT
jgi:hypothetical protein